MNAETLWNANRVAAQIKHAENDLKDINLTVDTGSLPTGLGSHTVTAIFSEEKLEEARNFIKEYLTELYESRIKELNDEFDSIK